MSAHTAAEEKLIIALDLPNVKAARALCDALDLPRAVLKIGLELVYAGGVELARDLAREGRRVFVDAKLLDIANTVERAAAQIASLGAEYATVHAHDGPTLKAAQRGSEGSGLKLLGVTVMTSLTRQTLVEQGFEMDVAALALRRASLAREAGLYGVIASPLELPQLKASFGAELSLITPGIRPKGGQSEIAGDDQMRTATPYEAICAGASAIVVGRPIVQARDPKAASRDVVEEIARALS